MWYKKVEFLLNTYANFHPRHQQKGTNRERERERQTIQKVQLKKTSQINRMAKTWGIAGNRLTRLINFCSDTLLLIPIHGSGAAGEKTFIPYFCFCVHSCRFNLSFSSSFCLFAAKPEITQTPGRFRFQIIFIQTRSNIYLIKKCSNYYFKNEQTNKKQVKATEKKNILFFCPLTLKFKPYWFSYPSFIFLLHFYLCYFS